jgi:hypothetical protein
MTEHQHNHSKQVQITIDHKRLESPTPTDGAALYALGGVEQGRTLYRETPGPHNDPPVANDNAEIRLEEGEKLYSEPSQPRRLEVEITIDRRHVRSPLKTTGTALYTLGEVPASYVLYRETSGPAEDEPIPNDATPIRVHEHEKFYSSPGQVTPGACR